MLEKSLANEDEFVATFGKSFLKDIAQSAALDDDQKKKVIEVLKVLLDDTTRHAKTVERLISAVKEANRDEF